MYTIKIEYETGDSFQNHHEVDYVGMAWNQMYKAERALNNIIEHYAFMKFCENSRRRRPPNKGLTQPQFDELIDKEWFYTHTTRMKRLTPENICDGVDWKNHLNVEDDKNQIITINAFWCGYFERLNGASIVLYNAVEHDYSSISKRINHVEDMMDKLQSYNNGE